MDVKVENSSAAV